MDRQRTNLIGMSLIIGAAVGFTLGLILADAGTTALLGAIGAGLGVVIGAVVSMLLSGTRSDGRDRRAASWHDGRMSGNDDAERARDRHDMPEAAVRDHLANERTLLAWQRTALGVLAIGFLVDRFALEGGGTTIAGSILGIALIVLGAVVSVVGAYRFMRTEREIDTQTYRPALLAHLVLTAGIVVGALALVLFLLATLD